jgi:hypothetical protein
VKVFPFVPAKWPEKLPVRVALVDEAPGDDAICSGKILSGWQGQLLRRALRLGNLDYNTLFITYLFDWQLCDDDVRKECLSRWLSEDYHGYTPRRLPSTGFISPRMVGASCPPCHTRNS